MRSFTERGPDVRPRHGLRFAAVVRVDAAVTDREFATAAGAFCQEGQLIAAGLRAEVHGLKSGLVGRAVRPATTILRLPTPTALRLCRGLLLGLLVAAVLLRAGNLGGRVLK